MAFGVGTFGFDHDEWSGGFYDSQLPLEWRFPFYCNQFRAIMLPSETSVALLAGQLPALVEDSDDGFRFVLELPALDYQVPFDKGVEALHSRIAGVVIHFDMKSRGIPSLEQAVDCGADLEADWPVCLDPGLVEPAELELVASAVEARRMSVLWRPELNPVPLSWGPLMVARLGEVPPGRVREVLDTLASCSESEGYAGVFFDAIESAPRRALECRIMAELMGY